MDPWVPERADPLGTAEPVVLRRVPLEIDPAEVRAFQAWKARIPADAPDQLEAARAAVAAVMRPEAVYRILPVERAEPDALRLRAGPWLRIPEIGERWGPVERVAAGLVTIGTEPETLAARRRAVGDLETAAWLDSAASAAVECLAEWLNDHLCRLAVARGLRATNRISPGVAGWALADHATLVRLLPAGALGIRVEPDGTTRPAKTISLLVGLGAAVRVDHYFLQCRRCWVEPCPARRGPATGRVARPGPGWTAG